MTNMFTSPAAGASPEGQPFDVWPHDYAVPKEVAEFTQKDYEELLRAAAAEAKIEEEV